MHFIKFHGWGGLTIGFFVLAFFVAWGVSSLSPSATPTIGLIIGFVAVAIGNWIVGTRVNRALLRSSESELHSLMFLPMEWWSLAFLLLAVVIAWGNWRELTSLL